MLIKNRHLRLNRGLMKPGLHLHHGTVRAPRTQSACALPAGCRRPITGEGIGVYFALLGFIQLLGSAALWEACDVADALASA